MQEYLQRKELLYIYESGLRANHFAVTCLPQLIDMILIRLILDSGMTLLHWHDLQKHFDTLGHTISFDKIKCIGFSDKAVEWFPCYLTSRDFFNIQCLFRHRKHKVRSYPRI